LCRTLYQWGLLALQCGQLEAAAASFEEILTIAPEEARLEPALARFGLAWVYAAQGKITQARQLGEQALAMLAAIGHREALQVRPRQPENSQEAARTSGEHSPIPPVKTRASRPPRAPSIEPMHERKRCTYISKARLARKLPSARAFKIERISPDRPEIPSRPV